MSKSSFQDFVKGVAAVPLGPLNWTGRSATITNKVSAAGQWTLAINQPQEEIFLMTKVFYAKHMNL